MSKIKVVWVCCFSNALVRSKLIKQESWFITLLKKVIPNEGSVANDDFALWNTRGINEFKKFSDIELHVISHANGIRQKLQKFELEGVNYYFYRDEADGLFSKLKYRLDGGKPFRHVKGDRIINQVIDEINPDLIHIIGAENYYSSFILDRNDSIPSIVYLQTLLCEPGFNERYKLLNEAHYKFRLDIEKRVIKRCDYIGTESSQFRDIILKDVDPNAKFFQMNVATNVEINVSDADKEYDFVYFANGISKACDYAIEAFGIAASKYPNLKLDVVGQYSEDYKKKMEDRLVELGILKNVTFEGSYPSHGDVIKQVMKSRFALLPFKVDYNPTTIPEAMSCGLPVVSSKTEGISVLYSDENNILLSDIGNHAAMADNMVRLIEQPDLVNKIKANAFALIKKDSNASRMRQWADIYSAVVNNNKNGVIIPEALFYK